MRTALHAGIPHVASIRGEERSSGDDAPVVSCIVTVVDGAEIDFELGEWLHGAQMAKAKRRERLTESVLGLR